nr:MATE family efflux transporter [uncultured Sphingomonas sp.]
MPVATPLTAETRRLLALAWPVMLTGLNWTILHVTDVVVVGLAGSHQVAALGASRTITFPGIVMGLGALTGILVHVSRADGAGELRQTGRVLHEGLLLALLLGMASMAILFGFAAPLLAGVGVAPDLVAASTPVVQVMALAYPFQLLTIATSFFLEGVSRPARVTVVNLAVLPINALLAWLLATGAWGLPALGAVGAATATAIASALGAIGMLAAAWTLPRAEPRGVRLLGDWGRAETWRGAWALARFGVVPAVASGLELVGFSILIALSTQLGETTAHAFQIVFSIHNVTFAVALGLGSAAGVRVGNAVGEGVPQAAAGRAGIAALLAGLATGLLAACLMLVPMLVVERFPAPGDVHAMAATMLLLWAPFILFDGVQVVFVYALRSLGDQVAAGINGILAFFLVTGGLGLWLVQAGFGATALVLASGLGMVAAALLDGGRLLVVTRRIRSRS